MPSTTPRPFIQLDYDKAAREYCQNLPLEHFMEAIPQATQQKITLESLDQVHTRRPDVQVFNELLVQYLVPGKEGLGQVVPDNMIVVHSEPIEADGSYSLPIQPVGPFFVLEYVSKSNAHKDHEENMQKYEHELKVRYYLLFHPDNQDLVLYKHNRRKYVKVRPNERGRLNISELDLEVAILDGWMRYWYQGELLLLAGEWLNELDKERHGRLKAEAKVAQLMEEMAKLKERLGNNS